jgi:TPR repeat protein
MLEFELYNNLEITTVNQVSNKKYFKFNTHDNIKKIEKRYGLNLKMYEESMVLDIFSNGLEITKPKYLDLLNLQNLQNLNNDIELEQNKKKIGKITNLFGLYLMSIDNISDAIEYFKNACVMGCTQSYNNIGRCYKIIQEFRLGEEFYLKAIEFGSQNSYAWLGCLYLKNKKYSHAINIWLKGKEFGCAKCCLFLGEYYESNEDYEKAKCYFEIGIELNNSESIYNSNELYGKIGILLWYDFDDYIKSIGFLEQGMSLGDSLSYYNYAVILEDKKGNLETCKIDDWENKILEYYKKSVQINMNFGAIIKLAQIYSNKLEYEKMISILNLGIELNDYDSIGMLANYLESNGYDNNNKENNKENKSEDLEKAIELYTKIREDFSCEYCLAKIANIYGSKHYNQIDEFIKYNKQSSILFYWFGCFQLGIYYLKSNNQSESQKYLMKALDLYWTVNNENQNIIFPNEFEHPNDTEQYDVNYYIDKYNKIFKLKDVLKTIKLSINDSLNIIDYINQIKKIFIKYTGNYYPVLIIILLNGIINDPKKMLEFFKKINKSFIIQCNFMFAMEKILENKINQKTIENRIKRAKKKKNYKDCIVCYENKIHVKFNCGHEICCNCCKKMYKCYYNCNS